MKTSSLLILVLIIFSCKKTEKDQPVIYEKAEKKCFSFMSQRDTITLDLVESQGKITGDLTYNLFEKDKNSGTIEGKMRGDTLLAAYKFHSEGKLSSREVAFLKKGDSYIEGYGPIEEVNNGFKFRDISDLNFTGNIILTPVDCE